MFKCTEFFRSPLSKFLSVRKNVNSNVEEETDITFLLPQFPEFVDSTLKTFQDQ